MDYSNFKVYNLNLPNILDFICEPLKTKNQYPNKNLNLNLFHRRDTALQLWQSVSFTKGCCFAVPTKLRFTKGFCFAVPTKLRFENPNNKKIRSSELGVFFFLLEFIRDHDGIRTHTLCSTTPSRWRVYQFLHVA